MPSLTCDVTLDDIEDIVSIKDNNSSNLYSQKLKVTSKNVRTKRTQEPVVKDGNDKIVNDSIIPGTQKIFIKTWGCTHNSSDSEYMAGQLSSYGYKIVEDSNAADLWLLNSCTVKNPAEDHFRNMLKKAQDSEIPIVLAGCVPQAAPNSSYIKGLSVIGVQQIDRVIEVVEETLKGNAVRLIGKKKENGKKIGGARLDLPKIRRNPLIEIISINTGCLNACTYCKTRHARGELGSYPIEDIVNRVKQSFGEGVVEIWLTSEDTGAYGRDIGTNLPELLWKIVEVIPDGCMLRVGMTNPPYILEHIQEMSKILNHPRVYAFMHIPVQSGSDGVLYAMQREYTRLDFCNVVDCLLKNVPGISIATDIICGFPTEMEEDFEDTMTLIDRYKFPSLFINQFYPRPGTPAAKMTQMDRQEIKRRTKKLSELFQSYKPYEHQLGTVQKVLIAEIAHDKMHYVGHNKYYEQVLISMDEDLMGKVIEVEIVETAKHYLKGVKISSIPVMSPGLRESLPQGCVSGSPKDGSGEREGSKEKTISQWTYNLGLISAFIAFVAVTFYSVWL